jgi:hypothetical protein
MGCPEGTPHRSSTEGACEGEKVEIALQAGAESTPRVPKGHVELLRGFAAQHSPHRATYWFIKYLPEENE